MGRQELTTEAGDVVIRVDRSVDAARVADGERDRRRRQLDEIGPRFEMCRQARERAPAALVAARKAWLDGAVERAMRVDDVALFTALRGAVAADRLTLALAFTFAFALALA